MVWTTKSLNFSLTMVRAAVSPSQHFEQRRVSSQFRVDDADKGATVLETGREGMATHFGSIVSTARYKMTLGLEIWIAEMV